VRERIAVPVEDLDREILRLAAGVTSTIGF
jgi:hypothetical protein